MLELELELELALESLRGRGRGGCFVSTTAGVMGGVYCGELATVLASTAASTMPSASGAAPDAAKLGDAVAARRRPSTRAWCAKGGIAKPAGLRCPVCGLLRGEALADLGGVPPPPPCLDATRDRDRDLDLERDLDRERDLDCGRELDLERERCAFMSAPATLRSLSCVHGVNCCTPGSALCGRGAGSAAATAMLAEMSEPLRDAPEALAAPSPNEALRNEAMALSRGLSRWGEPMAPRESGLSAAPLGRSTCSSLST